MTSDAIGTSTTETGGFRPNLQQRSAWLKDAKDLIHDGKWDPVDPFRLAKQLRELGIYGEGSIRAALLEALDEIDPRDYRGDFPPEPSYEDACKGAELCPFAWTSTSRCCPMYLKFAFFDGRLKVVTFHRQRERSK